MNGFEPCPDCVAYQADRDDVLLQLGEVQAELKSARTITSQELKSAEIVARDAYGEATSAGHYYDRFSLTVRAVLRELGFEVRDD